MRLALNMATMAKVGVSRTAIEEMAELIEEPGAEVQEEKKQDVVFTGNDKVKAVIEIHPAMVCETLTNSCCLANMAQQRLHRQAGVAMARVRLHHNWCHLGPQCHLRHLVTVRDVNALKQMVCYPDMCIYALFFPAPNISILICVPRIASVIKVLFQIC
jgi:hypothetical protein